MKLDFPERVAGEMAVSGSGAPNLAKRELNERIGLVPTVEIRGSAESQTSIIGWRICLRLG